MKRFRKDIISVIAVSSLSTMLLCNLQGSEVLAAEKSEGELFYPSLTMTITLTEDLETEPETETETETETEPETETETETETEPETETEIETETETETETEPEPLEYTITIPGFEDGNVSVKVMIAPDCETIEDVQIVDCSSQTDIIGQVAAPAVAAEILEAQSAEVDGVSGATQTSDAVKTAAGRALKKAQREKRRREQLAASHQKETEPETEETNVGEKKSKSLQRKKWKSE